jgi:hypothetical protein
MWHRVEQRLEVEEILRWRRTGQVDEDHALGPRPPVGAQQRARRAAQHAARRFALLPAHRAGLIAEQPASAKPPRPEARANRKSRRVQASP